MNKHRITGGVYGLSFDEDRSGSLDQGMEAARRKDKEKAERRNDDTHWMTSPSLPIPGCALFPNLL